MLNFKILRKSLSVIFLLVYLIPDVFSQNVTIKGKADEYYRGKVLELFVTTDHVTGLRVSEDRDTIGADGFFELQLHLTHTQPVLLKCENIVATLYAEEGYVYGITLPEPDENAIISKDVEVAVNPGIIGNDTTELNMLIFDYARQYNSVFASADNRYLSRAMMFRRADSLEKMCRKRYSAIKNVYFHNYVQYSIASVNASVSRGENYLINGYIINQPIRYDHAEYMQFFRSCFKGYMQSLASRHKGMSLFHIINVKADYQVLTAYLKEDRFLRSDSIRELVILTNLWDLYFDPGFQQQGIEQIVSALATDSKIARHRTIAGNMLAFFNKMQVGAPAPDFSAKSKDGKAGSLGNFKGRWVYLNFFSTSNTESLKEMKKIESLKKKYGSKVIFLSICLDEKPATWIAYLKANPRFDWPIWYNNDPAFTATAKEKYSVSGTEAYFLISNMGNLAQSPALSPSQGIEYKFNVIFRMRVRNTKTGIR